MAPQVRADSAFFAGLRAGPTEREGQDRLATAFHSYLGAFDSNDLETKRTEMIAGNCEIVYHEHIKLEPYIRGAMRWIVRRCATQRLMTYEIGGKVLTVGEDLPGISTPTAARNWTQIEGRILGATFFASSENFTMPLRCFRGLSRDGAVVFSLFIDVRHASDERMSITPYLISAEFSATLENEHKSRPSVNLPAGVFLWSRFWRKKI